MYTSFLVGTFRTILVSEVRLTLYCIAFDELNEMLTTSFSSRVAILNSVEALTSRNTQTENVKPVPPPMLLVREETILGVSTRFPPVIAHAGGGGWGGIVFGAYGGAGGGSDGGDDGGGGEGGGDGDGEGGGKGGGGGAGGSAQQST